jgi:hypothetical protein
MPFVLIPITLLAIGYKAYQHKGIAIENVEDPEFFGPWELPTNETEINKNWYGRFYQDDVILGILALYVILKAKPWK